MSVFIKSDTLNTMFPSFNIETKREVELSYNAYRQKQLLIQFMMPRKKHTHKKPQKTRKPEKGV